MAAQKTFLNENDVLVTNKALTTPKGTFPFSRIKNIRIIRWKTGLLFWRTATFRMIVDNFNEEIIALETKDKDFLQRVQRAMNQAAQRR